MQLSENAVRDFSKSLKIRGRQPATIESYQRDAQGFVDFMKDSGIDLGSVQSQTLVDYQEHLRYGCDERHNSIRRAVIGIRQFFRFLVDEREILDSPLDQVTIPPRDETLPAGISTEDLDALFDEASKLTPAIKSSRDGAFLALLGLEGLKVGELINLKWSDFLDEKTKGSLKITGTRSRVIQLSPETTVMMATYLEQYRQTIPESWIQDKDSRMFIAFKGRDSGTPMPQITRHGLKFMLYELGGKANIKGLNTEMLRHHATQYLLENGKSADEIMQHFGLRRIGNIAKHIARFAKENPPEQENA